VSKRKEAAAERSRQAEQQVWEEQQAELVDKIEIAREGDGVTEAEGLVLKAGEQVYAVVTESALIEERRGAGQWQGRSSGVSVPVGGLRLRMGQSKGHYVQGAAAPTPIDKGTFFVTTLRAVFQGAAQTRECLWAKLIAVRHDDGWSTFSVSNRQKPTTIFYGSQVAGLVQFRIDMALAVANGTRDAFVAKLEGQLAELDGRHPAAMATAVPAAIPAVSPARPETASPAVSNPAMPEAPRPPAAWYPDPGGQPVLRWWDGATWTEHTAPLS
jgi:hypothetical protein